MSKRKNKKNNRPQNTEQGRMSPEDAYDLCDALDLPDGAFWAMVEEMSGATPDDFVD